MRRFIVLCVALLSAACTIGRQESPAISGPSTLALTLSIVATPDVLPRDGQAVSTIRVTARDAQGRGIPNQRVLLNVNEGGGTLSAGEITTDANGVGIVQFVAPAAITNAVSASITATPISDLVTPLSQTQRTVIALVGPRIVTPVAAFSFSPSTPGEQDLVAFNAATSTVDGQPCAAACTFAWDFGDGDSAQGPFATHRFARGTYLVRLTVTSASGGVATTSQTVTVGAPAALTTLFSFSPTNPRVNETVFFNASSSTTPDGAQITSYAWDFGNGTTADGVSATTTFTQARTYVVRLTITDERGRTGTVTQNVAVAVP